MPLISIITVTFNAINTLEQTIESIINQLYSDFEYVIIDGGSTDGTIELIKKYPFIRYISEKDNGIYDAMNKGIKMAKGDWLYFIGSDDVLYDSTVLYKIFSKPQPLSTKVIYGNVIFKHSGNIYDGKFSFFKLNDRNICHQAIFYRKEMFIRFGHYDVKYVGLADWVFNIKWFCSNIKYQFIDEIIAIYNEDGFCFNSDDVSYLKDSEKIKKLYFPFWMFMILDLRRSKWGAKLGNYIFSKLY